MFLAEVGFVEGNVVRKSGDLLGVHLNLPPSIERDLLIRKLFTAAVANVSVDVSATAATGMLLRSIWSASSAPANPAPGETAVAAIEKLPPTSLVIPPRAPEIPLDKIVAARRAIAA
jgi:cellulose synthase (UDP-forming)